MLKRAAIAVLSLVAMAALAVWLLAGNGPRPLRHGLDVAVRSVAGVDPISRCWDKFANPDGHTSFGFIGDRRCYTFEASQTFSGIYIDEFEGHRFIAGASGLPPYHPRDNIWFSIDEPARQALMRNIPPERRRWTKLWQIVFVGRKANGPGGFGHLGGFDGLVVVDQIKSATVIASIDGYLPEEYRR